MIQLQFFTSIKKIEDRIKTLYDKHSCIINLETENINSNNLIVHAENHNLPTYGVLEASFIYDLIKNILQTNKTFLLLCFLNINWIIFLFLKFNLSSSLLIFYHYF